MKPHSTSLSFYLLYLTYGLLARQRVVELQGEKLSNWCELTL